MGNLNKYIVANWKMNPNSYNEAINLVDAYLKTINNKIINNIILIIAPPAVYIQNIYNKLQSLNYHNNILLCAQNICWQYQGAFTGELSAHSVANVGCKYVLIGHSERRLYNHETDDLIANKFSMAINAGLMPIICVGENKLEFDHQHTWQVLDRQLNFLQQVSTKSAQQTCMVAYEPVWAIGSGASADLKYIEQVNNYILQMFPSMNIQVLYGGSVNPTNCQEIANLSSSSGVLVGASSLDASQFAKIYESIIELKKNKQEQRLN